MMQEHKRRLIVTLKQEIFCGKTNANIIFCDYTDTKGNVLVYEVAEESFCIPFHNVLGVCKNMNYDETAFVKSIVNSK